MLAILMLSTLLAKPQCVAQCAPIAAALCDGRPHCTRVHLKKLVRQCRHQRRVCTTTTTSTTTMRPTTTMFSPCPGHDPGTCPTTTTAPRECQPPNFIGAACTTSSTTTLPGSPSGAFAWR